VSRGPASDHIGNNEIHSNSELELDRATRPLRISYQMRCVPVAGSRRLV